MKIPCNPQLGLTALIMGQDYYSVKNYTTYVDSHRDPFGLATYAALKQVNGSILGLSSPIDYGSGFEWTLGMEELYKKCSIQVGLWVKENYATIPSGSADVAIKELIAFVNKSETTYYIRVGYEFDSYANDYEPVQYRQMFRYIVQTFRSYAITNVAFVWHASGFKPRDNIPYKEWFPGRDVVTWCGVSLFQQPYHCNTSGDCASMRYADQFADFCASINLPIMIAESAPFGGIIEPTEEESTGTSTRSTSSTILNEAGFSGDTWNIWFVPVLAFISRHQVRAWSYINCYWDAQPMWQKEHAPGERWGDTRLEVHRETLALWDKHVLQNPRFLLHYPNNLASFYAQCDGPSAIVSDTNTATTTSATNTYTATNADADNIAFTSTATQHSRGIIVLLVALCILPMVLKCVYLIRNYCYAFTACIKRDKLRSDYEQIL